MGTDQNKKRFELCFRALIVSSQMSRQLAKCNFTRLPGKWIATWCVLVMELQRPKMLVEWQLNGLYSTAVISST